MRTRSIRLTPRVLTGLGLAIGVFTACRRGSDAREGVSIDTLPSGTVVVRNPSSGGWDSSNAWTVTEMTRVGGEDADSASAFGRVAGVALDGAGRLYVADAQALTILVFDTAGRLVRKLGRSGQGPGEFGQITGLKQSPRGDLWVADPQNDRYTVFDTAGNVLQTQPRTVGGFSAEWDGAFDDRGHLLETSRSSGGPPMFVRHVVDSASLAAIDSVPVPVFSAPYYQIQFDRAAMNVPVPFAAGMTWRFDGHEGYWIGVSDRYRLVHQSFAGDTMRMIERAIEASPVSSAERAAAEKRVTEIPYPARFGPVRSPPLDLSLIPETKPLFTTFIIDEARHIWVARTGASDEAPERYVTYDVYDPDGVFLGPLRLGIVGRPTPVIQAERIAGVVRDSLGTETVVVYRLTRR